MGKKKLGEDITGMSAPNHNIGLDWELKAISEPPEMDQLYPILELKVPESPGSGTVEGHAFFDYSYPTAEISGRSEPPTWMDPVLFVEMADKLSEVRALARKCAKKNYATSADIRKMEDMLQELFEGEYLVYVFGKFEKCRKILAMWLFAHYDYLNDSGDGVLPDKRERLETLESRRLSRLKIKGET